ncbi:restriction endonuclease [Haloferax profundi]|uniref:restriction endonuclease n=1 Tax=Haloferax profundi TaxID=1544718 RepID=UPI0009EB53E0|nr:restriction endonuclease [Haloferax profundi]
MGIFDKIRRGRSDDYSDHREKEHEVAKKSEKDGWSCDVTPATRDGGYDVDCRRESDDSEERRVVEVKHRKDKVHSSEIDRLADVAEKEGAGAAYHSTNGYTGPAKKRAEERGVEITEGDELDDEPKWKFW